MAEFSAMAPCVRESDAGGVDAQHADGAASFTFPQLSRRSLLKVSFAGATALSGGALSACAESTAQPVPPTPSSVAGMVFGQTPSTRAAVARQLKLDAAAAHFAAHPATAQTINTDETALTGYIGNFSKTLRHNSVGEVIPESYNSYLNALFSGQSSAFDNIDVGNPGLPGRYGLVSPQAAFAFEMSGMDCQAPRLPTAPVFASSITAAEMVELYWYALCRDVPFARYSTDPLIAAAVADMNTLTRSDIFARQGGQVTPQTLFRSTLPGAAAGPFVSQFLLQPFYLGAYEIGQKYRRVAEGAVNNYMTDFATYLAIQNGAPPAQNTTFESTHTHLYSMRQMGEWVHVDGPVQTALFAATRLFEMNAFDDTLPYIANPTQAGFVTFGKADIQHLITRVSRHALTAAWYQKWLCHRRLRPENFAARINVHQRGLRTYPIHSDVLDSDALARINASQSDAANRGLLPMGYPEGCPGHPAYPGGHSAFSAASATIVKAFFNEDMVIPSPVQPSADGLSLEPWTGGDLTVGGELNKLVGNVTHCRDGAGMHYRSDGAGNFLGEEVAVSVLTDYSRAYNELFDGFHLTRFNGQRIRISNGAVQNI